MQRSPLLFRPCPNHVSLPVGLWRRLVGRFLGAAKPLNFSKRLLAALEAASPDEIAPNEQLLAIRLTHRPNCRLHDGSTGVGVLSCLFEKLVGMLRLHESGIGRGV